MSSPKLACAIFALFSLIIVATAAKEPEIVLLIGGKSLGDGLESNIESVEVFGQDGCAPNLTLIDGRDDSTGHYIDGHILVCGGGSDLKSCIQLVDGEFKEHSRLKVKRLWHSGVVLEGKLIIMGGFPFDGDISNTMETLNETTWTLSNNKLEHGSLVQESCVVALDNTRAMIIGGYGSRGSVDAVSIYDAENGWTAINSLPKRMSYYTSRGKRYYYPTQGKRYAHSCVVLGNGHVLVAGGIGPGKELDTAVIYNGDSWEELSGKLNTGRSHGQMVKVNGRILYIGGKDNDGNVLDTVEEFDEDTETWALLQQTMDNPRKSFAAVVVPASAVGCHL